jgi:L-seryl-tRNA(Ser) seleniumtransferase
MRVHRSNFRITGFTARPDLAELAALGRERGVPVYEDLGSGCLADLQPFGIDDEPLVADSLRAGADLVSFSGDKLLGGPQAGILAGKAELVTRLRRNPLFRALRVDKLIYQTLESTLRNLLLERWQRIPALAMIRQTAVEVYERTAALLERFPEIDAEILPGKSVVGGGATPDQSLPTWLIAPQSDSVVKAERLLRASEPPVIGRIENERLVLDLRTVLPGEEDLLGQALTALGRDRGDSTDGSGGN